MSPDSSLERARALQGYRSKAAPSAAAVVAATAAAAGILKVSDPLSNGWSMVALVATGAGLLITLLNFFDEVRTSRRMKEVVVALSTVSTDRHTLQAWADREHLRGVIYVDAVANDDTAVTVAALPIRMGELLSTASNPVVVLRALTEVKPPRRVKAFDVRFVPERSDQFVWLRQLYEKDDLADWLFEARDLRVKRGRTAFAPDVVIVCNDGESMEKRALAFSPDPKGCLRVSSKRYRSSDDTGELPSVFNVVSELRVSVSGVGDFVVSVSREHLRERFGLYARLVETRQINVVDFESVLRLGETPPVPSVEELLAM